MAFYSLLVLELRQHWGNGDTEEGPKGFGRGVCWFGRYSRTGIGSMQPRAGNVHPNPRGHVPGALKVT